LLYIEGKSLVYQESDKGLIEEFLMNNKPINIITNIIKNKINEKIFIFLVKNLFQNNCMLFI
jgi:hypothetical protein